MTIAKNIYLKYRRKAILCLFFTLALFTVWINYPFRQFFSPIKIQSSFHLSQDTKYVSVENITLHYSGYYNQKKNKPEGYFYYGFLGEKCLFFLLTPQTCNNGQESITLPAIRGTLYVNSSFYDQLTGYLAEDLDWDKQQLSLVAQPYLIYEAGYNYPFHLFVFLLLTTFTVGILLTLALYLAIMKFPYLSYLPVCSFSPKKAAQFLSEAEGELAEHCLITAKDFFITDRFILNLSKYHALILPIEDLVWVYDHSTVSGLSGKNKKIFYSLTFYNKHKRAKHSTHNQKEDVDTVLSYLRDYFPEILNGFTLENKKAFRDL